MNFTDNLGNIFSLKSYSEYPIGYEYETNKYVFWVDSDYSHKLTIGNWYVKPIRFVLDHKPESVNIYLNSDKFKLLNKIPESLEIDLDSLTTTLSDLYIIEGLSGNDGSTLYLCNFYIFAKSDEEGTWTTQVMINVDNEWCPISVAASFVDVCEELEINASNFGKKFPKEILKAVWEQSYNNDVPDINLYNIKLKEWLLNHMLISGECGNYRSALASLEWFGWGDKLSLSKLLKTDNDFLDQYIHDYFNLDNDIDESFKYFKQTILLSLYFSINKETGNIYEVDDNLDLWGEGKPILEDLESKYDESIIDSITYKKKVIEWSMHEISLKLACLSYMYKKYFLPMHLSIHSASVRRTVFANDMKMLNDSYLGLTEKPIYDYDADFDTSIEFYERKDLYISTDKIILDENDFCIKDKESDSYIGSENFYPYIYVPVNIISTNDIVDITVVLSKNNMQIFDKHFVYATDKYDFEGICIIPSKYISTFDKDFWESGIFTLDIKLNGVWYSYDFSIPVTQPKILFGTLQYVYDHEKCKQINSISDTSIDFNAVFADNDIANISIINDFKYYDNISIIKDNTELLDKYIISQIQTVKIGKHKEFFNKIYIYDIENNGNSIQYDKHTFGDELSTDIALYRKFFNDDGEIKDTETFNTEDYDFYLMHNNTKYFIVAISKKTINYAINLPINKNHINIGTDNYDLIYLRSSDIFMLERMMINWKTSGYNHFKTTDIIISVLTNVNLPVISNMSNKWEYKGISISNKNIKSVYFGSVAGIMSIEENQSEYISGYYDAICTYSTDNFYSHNRILKGKILIEK